jgi:hypothetical protein
MIINAEALTTAQARAWLEEKATWLSGTEISLLLREASETGLARHGKASRILVSDYGGRFWITLREEEEEK